MTINEDIHIKNSGVLLLHNCRVNGKITGDNSGDIKTGGDTINVRIGNQIGRNLCLGGLTAAEIQKFI